MLVGVDAIVGDPSQRPRARRQHGEERGSRTRTSSARMNAVRRHDTIIRPPSELGHLDAREVYRYRHLLVALVRRNVRLQFQAASLGFLWVCLRPLVYVAIFGSFRRLSNADVQVEIAYPLYVYSGLILWYYVVETTMQAAGAVRADAHLVTKVYYPRLVSPLVPILANVVGLAVAMVPLVLMMAWYGVGPGWRLLVLPVVLAVCMCLILGVGAACAALTLRNRDWERLLSFMLYVGLFVSPVIYAVEMIPEPFRLLYVMNPMAGILQAFRSALFARVEFPLWASVYAGGIAVGILGLGVTMFRRAESRFADEL
jgi:lipopolysaccharide transport system permease protein